MGVETWLIVVLVGLAVLAGLVFLRVLSGVVKQTLEQHDTAREAMEMRIEYFGSQPKRDASVGVTILDDA